MTPRTKDGRFAKKNDGMTLTIEEVGGKVYRFKDFGMLKEWLDNGKTFTNTPVASTDNPDCEVATKGYVKCIARTLVDKTRKHLYYKVDSSTKDAATCCSAVLLSFAWIVSMLAKNEPSAAWSTGIGALICLMLFMLPEPKIELETREYVKAIQKYEPPTCEKKRECDE